MYTWQKELSHVTEEGPEKIVRFFKIALSHLPRLEAQIDSPREAESARKETIALFKEIDSAMRIALKETPLSEEAFTTAVRKSSLFTPEELRLLSRVPELIGEHHTALFSRQAFKTPKKRSPYFKV